jgi:hypothetical protein
MKLGLFVLLIIFLSGCGVNVPSPAQRKAYADKLVGNKFKARVFHTKEFEIFSYEGNLSGCKKAYVYIEGDGLAWITSDTVSSDPTPLNPEALKMALQNQNKCVIYLARPCQYVRDKKCGYEYWTDARFSKEVIKSYQEVLNKLKSEYGIRSFVLIGYSGGGAIAVILTAYRKDVALVVTVAGNLDIEKWCKIHYLTPLKNSLNPADFTDMLENKKQIHLIGGKDRITGEKVFFSYYDKFKNKKNIKYVIVKDYKHNGDWGKILKNILR